MGNQNNISASWREYQALPDSEWRKVFFCPETGGFVATHIHKYKQGESNPRGYPDAYFDGQTWDFKLSTSKNEDTLRQLIKDGRKADNVIFISMVDVQYDHSMTQSAIGREYGRKLKNGTWQELPNVFYYSANQLIALWKK